MTRAIVVADSGAAMAQVSLVLRSVRNVEIVRYASGGSPVSRVMRAGVPDVVLVVELRRAADTLTRVSEIRTAAPGAAVVVIATDPGAGWLAEALRRGAAAVLPAGIEAPTLELVLGEVLESTTRAEPPTSLAA